MQNKWVTGLFASLIFWSSSARSEVGVSYFAIQSKNFPCERALSVFNGVKKPSISILWSTFGTSANCLNKFASLPGEKTLQIHASNGSCVRLGRCKAGEVDIRNEGKYRRRLRQIKAYTDTLPKDMTLILSLQLEDNLSKAQAVRAYGWAKEIWPYAISRNPIKDLHKVGLLELHDSHRNAKKKGAHIWSNDGIDINFGKGCSLPRCVRWSRISQEVLTHSKTFERSYLWWNNQGAKDGKRFVEPRKRRFNLSRQSVVAVRKLLRRIHGN